MRGIAVTAASSSATSSSSATTTPSSAGIIASAVVVIVVIVIVVAVAVVAPAAVHFWILDNGYCNSCFVFVWIVLIVCETVRKKRIHHCFMFMIADAS